MPQALSVLYRVSVWVSLLTTYPIKTDRSRRRTTSFRAIRSWCRLSVFHTNERCTNLICSSFSPSHVSYAQMLFSTYKAPLPSHAFHIFSSSLISIHILVSPGKPMFLTSTPFRNSASPGIFPCLINSALWLMIGSIIMLATATTVSPFP